MKVEDVIKLVYELQQELEDVDGLSHIFQLTVLTDGYDWSVMFYDISLTDNEVFDLDCSEDDLKKEIIEQMKEIQNYLNIVLVGK